MSDTPPYFFSDTLCARFALDIQDAVEQARISLGQSQWLLGLTSEPATPDISAPRPEAYRLVTSDGSAVNAELAGALLFSSQDTGDTAVFLSTLTFGIERFEQRAALLTTLQQRFDDIGTQVVINAELVEGPLFEARTLSIMRQQARHLEGLWSQLHDLPDLRMAAGKAFQEGLIQRGAGAGIDVFSHLLQIVDSRPLTDRVLTAVVGTQYLADSALDEIVSERLPPGLFHQFMDHEGRALADPEASQFQQALSGAVSEIGTVYERLLADYWTSTQADGRTRRESVIHALAECFRQHLLASRADGSLSYAEYRRLLDLLPSHQAASDPQSVRVRRLSAVVAGQEPVKLVGLLLLDFPADASSGMYLYASLSGFRHFASSEQLVAFLTSDPARAALLFYSSLNDHIAVRTPGSVELYQELTTADFFSECMDSLIAMQQRNLRHVLGLPAIGFEQTPVRIDDALDIRAYLDGRLLSLQDPGRWRSSPVAFDQLWGASAAAAQSTVRISHEASDTWLGKLKKIETLLARQDALHVGVDGCMLHALNRYLAQVDGPRLDAQALWVVGTAGDEQPLPLLSVALDRACGHVQATRSAGQVLEGLTAPISDRPVRRLPVSLLEQMLTCVLKDFPARFERQVGEFFVKSSRYRDMTVHPGVLCGLIREYALRLELLMEKRIATLPESTLLRVQQVLDRPQRSMRAALGETRVEAYTLSISYDAHTPSITLPNTFVVGGALDPVLWSLGRGLTLFENVATLEQYVLSHLFGSTEGAPLSGLLNPPDRQALLAYFGRVQAPEVKLTLQRIDGHFIEALQHQEIERQQRTAADLYRQAVTWQLPSSTFNYLLSAAERDDRNRQALSNLGVAIQFIIYKAVVPVWISEAPMLDQVSLVEAMRRFYVICVGRKDFLFDIPGLYEYSQAQLIARLKADFPEQYLDPEAILVTLTHYVPVPAAPGQVPASIPAATQRISENLVEFAAKRFMSRQDGVISLASADGRPLPATLTPLYIRSLAESLDVAAGYRVLLTSALATTSPTYLERKQLFTEQMPALDTLRALVLRLRKELSDQAYRFIEGVLNMPDGVARLPVQGLKVVLSPLQLLPATQGWAPAVVANTYLIGPAEPHSGPWILYALMHDEFVFKEYPHRAALLEDIRTSASLQAFILSRIDSELRRIYDNGGFVEPHLPFSVESSFDVPWEQPPSVSLSIEPFEGNATELLFKGAVDALKLEVRQESVTNAEHRRSASQYLFSLGAEQIMTLMPGRLGVLIGVWQSQTLLNSSAVSAGEQRWGKAFSEFMAALSVMISARQNPRALDARLDEEVGTLAEEAGSDDPDENNPSPLEFSWSNISLTQQIRARLREFEFHTVALNALERDELMNTYNDLVTGSTYAAVDGKVFELRSDAEGWFIVAHGKIGPSVRLDENQRWRLDIQSGLKGGGGMVTHMYREIVDDDVDEAMVVNARGMSEIRRTYREMAQSIEEAHAQAQRYLENSLANLALRSPEGAADARVKRILAEFFSEKTPDDRLYEMTRTAVTDIYQALMDPSLSPIDSPRYVVGINRIGHESTSGFVIPADPHQRIFLTELFFHAPEYRFKISAMRSGDFRFGSHYRAAILVHELSHLALDTADIAYVDSQAPYLDLLDDASEHRKKLINQQVTLQQKTLSYNTDRSQLFSKLEDGEIRDLRRRDGEGKQAVLRITGKPTLDQARDVFYSDVQKRAKIMLKNADSLTLLITVLGRERFVPR
ncbi:hypothetical protein SAMN05444064_11613 [Pseudomonas syringae]|uniref:dermonecrotic toxin domain-containing protein n=1 Tax=Pseudomonas syringae TaxID=317 RepID=UPI0008997864|nr:DUF6543 domain-containing protein [Pseudomonas syringae]SDX22526.1 hypothetical protein SAMN05444514_11513 [Pseudomonas syringae]SFM39584.1 hypothetical protein SAMN05444064_11613 [Pseudomonas syringae]